MLTTPFATCIKHVFGGGFLLLTALACAQPRVPEVSPAHRAAVELVKAAELVQGALTVAKAYERAGAPAPQRWVDLLSMGHLDALPAALKLDYAQGIADIDVVVSRTVCEETLKLAQAEQRANVDVPNFVSAFTCELSTPTFRYRLQAQPPF